jgi:hypothetical protein
MLRCATNARWNMRCLVTGGKHVNDTVAIARQPPVTIEGLLEVVIYIGSPQDYIANTPRRLSELSCGILAGQ